MRKAGAMRHPFALVALGDLGETTSYLGLTPLEDAVFLDACLAETEAEALLDCLGGACVASGP